MANKVNVTPAISHYMGAATVAGVGEFLSTLVSNLFFEFAAHAQRLNAAIIADGSEPMTHPLTLASYAVADVPDAAAYTAGLIYVNNEAGGAVPAFSDGTNWRRVTDRAIVS